MDAVQDSWSCQDRKVVEALIEVLLDREFDQEDFRTGIFENGHIYVLAGTSVLPLMQAAMKSLEGTNYPVAKKYPLAIMAVKIVEVNGKYCAQRIDTSDDGWKDPSDAYDLNKNVKLVWPKNSDIIYLYRRFTEGTIEFQGTKPVIRTLIINGENTYMDIHELNHNCIPGDNRVLFRNEGGHQAKHPGRLGDTF
jgi:hypothetical protein